MSKEYKVEKRIKNKEDWAVFDKVFDKKITRTIENLISNKQMINFHYGAIQSGKEANIYSAKINSYTLNKSKFTVKEEHNNNEWVNCVIKIYKTSTMTFKNKSSYIVDEIRFKNYCTSNSRKVIKVWAEKEVRNLNRCIKNGIKAPKPFYLKDSLLIMEMIQNKDNSIANRLVDVIDNNWDDLYKKSLNILFDLYNKAKLVHADFSSYNLLVADDELYVIDLGQSIERTHLNSNSFLINDINNNNNYFKSKGVVVKDTNEIFEWITSLKIPHSLEGVKLNKDCFIPSCISEVNNPEDLELFVTNRPCLIDALKTVDEESSEEFRDDEDVMKGFDEVNKEENEINDALEQKRLRKERKKMVKEFNRQRRINRVEREKSMKKK
ncbi:RIO1 [Hepatospora eriocheir]|uniref:non-specific serine/threonine protein kinase n=1 Tax=Hepatospora eriocheir TaxID=1081669 RepID=A0A1X0QK97_9MICR|nr:RIO1 [Hepatospora eriocheir]